MAGMDGHVDRAYLVSVEGLRDICSGLTDGKREYKVTCDEGKTVAISYKDGPDDLNALCFIFPIVVNLNVNRASLLRLFGKQWPFGEDGLMVGLHVYLQKQTRKGLYLEGNKLFWDSLEDWEKFWVPLEAALIKGMECRSQF
jgi:hypothetical protein